jgi:hypothetical protein
MLVTKYIRSHKTTAAIFIFLILFTMVHLLKPGFAYTEDGGFRQFGVGYKHKTVVPIWVVAIILAIFSYVLIVYVY